MSKHQRTIQKVLRVSVQERSQEYFFGNVLQIIIKRMTLEYENYS